MKLNRFMKKKIEKLTLFSDKHQIVYVNKLSIDHFLLNHHAKLIPVEPMDLLLLVLGRWLSIGFHVKMVLEMGLMLPAVMTTFLIYFPFEEKKYIIGRKFDIFRTHLIISGNYFRLCVA